MGDELRRQADDVLRYYADLDRRVATAGLDGIVELLTVSQQVASALQVVEPPEIGRAVRELRGLLERLVRIDSELQGARALKARIGGDETPRAIESKRG
ncbi:MAG: hypothetical protein IT294_15680 [Deltaproteobacteria bacterium]|nr:hypothetical protein [Deltaproteobacteria bacterium]